MKRYIRDALRSPIVIFALATGFIVALLAPFFALSSTSY